MVEQESQNNKFSSKLARKKNQIRRRLEIYITSNKKLIINQNLKT